MKVNWRKLHPQSRYSINGNLVYLDPRVAHVLGAGEVKISAEGNSWRPNQGIELYLLYKDEPIGLSRSEQFYLCIARGTFQVAFIKVFQMGEQIQIQPIDMVNLPQHVQAEYDIQS